MLKKILLFLAVTLSVSMLSVVGYGYYQVQKTIKSVKPLSNTNNKLKEIKIPFDKKMNILVLGIDTGDLGRDDQGRSDTILLTHLNFDKNEHTLLSVERDSLVEIPGYSNQNKLNAAYAYGGVETAQKTVEQLFNTEIPYYVTVNMKGFQSILEIAGPITVHNSFEFSYDDCHFKQGDILLEPDQALAWVRMRYEDPRGNYGRQMRQQELVKQLVNHLSKVENLYKMPQLLAVLGENLKTNIPIEELIKSIDLTKLNLDLKTEQVQGENTFIDGVSYEVISAAERERVRQLLSFKE